MRRWSTRTVALTAALVIALTASGCATTRTPDDSPGALPAGVPTPTETIEHGTASGGPPPFTIRYDDTELVLPATSWCYGNSCADGYDMHPPSVGSPDEVFVFVPVAGFETLSASQRSSGDWCAARTVEAEVTDLGDGWWSVHPQGAAGTWTLDFFAGGDGGGDMAASVAWDTPADQPLPEPEASVVVIADHDGEPDSYGVELRVWNLAETPVDAVAEITVTAADGESLTFEATRDTDCAGEGALYFDGPASAGLEAAALGDFPFTYDVTLTIDGAEHTASGVYPDDAPPQDLAVPLEFSPALD
ncbi:hypothetical protein JOD63_002690 [Microbacterium terrae]|uniref:Uncharacterized protein n=1 Tax=Microbacterium terrae TaxID=69369 RepID=A0A0M2HLW9_9MICO|nr:hypothetical protein [Microbacterium terrae]KJL45407.1 hypothetical protein RS81_00229 [Microbacterium terrae]MBP1078722.1 hypothetical protein [Microbacterium terrae]GLJ98123.1 hypothetical protein GCM10017594_13200 [Microbacterium terrae]